MASELLVISLDLVKNRIGVMSTDMRRNFIQLILTSLIEKSPDAKVLKTIVKMVEEWVKAKVKVQRSSSQSEIWDLPLTSWMLYQLSYQVRWGRTLI